MEEEVAKLAEWHRNEAAFHARQVRFHQDRAEEMRRALDQLVRPLGKDLLKNYAVPATNAFSKTDEG